MKFIRDIIAEKTKPADEGEYPASDYGPDSLPDLVDAQDHPEEIDPVHMVASGGRSLGRVGNQSHFGVKDLQEPQEATELPPAIPEQRAEDGESDNFDRLSDPGDRQAATTAASEYNRQPAELFADIWSEEQQDSTDADPEEDLFAVDTDARQLADTSTPFVLQNPREPVPAPDSGPAEPQGASAFQRIIRRQDAAPTVPKPAPVAERKSAMASEPVQVPAPDAGRSRRPAGRVKTRLLGFGNDFERETDPFAADNTAVPAAQTMFAVGWIVITSGPGRGTSFTLFNGVSQIGRGEDQAVRLDYGDTSISRINHAAVAYDPEQKAFFLGHGGKTNLVRLNGNPVLSTEPLTSGALIRIGETTLRFVALCGDDFDWDKSQQEESENARFG